MYNTAQCTLTTTIASAMHMLVDCLCICVLYLLSRSFTGDEIVTAILLYNILAFCTQPLTGMIADWIPDRRMLLYASVILLAVAVVIVGITHEGRLLLPVVAIVLGMGNSLFHVWGGKQTAVKSGNDIVSLGVFVSTGSLGLAIGGIFSSYALMYVVMALIVMLALVYVSIDKENACGVDCGDDDKRAVSYKWYYVTAAMLLLSLAVMTRSFVGDGFSSSVAKGGSAVLLVAGVAAAGKILGGVLTEYVGLVRTALLLVAAVAICYPLRCSAPTVALGGVFAVNCTMPITLYLANRVLKGKEGLAFGLLAASLIPGYLIAAT